MMDAVIEDETATKDRRAEVKAKALPVYRYNPSLQVDQASRLKAAFARSRVLLGLNSPGKESSKRPRGRPFRSLPAAVKACARLTVYPVIAIALFLLNSRWTIGAWFISSGFFVPENTAALGHPAEAWRQVREGIYHLSGPALVWSAYAAAVLSAVAFVRSRGRSALVLLLALPAAGALPFYAYYEGHPFIARYGIPMVVGYAATAGAAIGLLWRPLRAVAAAVTSSLGAASRGPAARSRVLTEIPNLSAASISEGATPR